jgi:2-polyprenyl-3-methyl-5-hydroxy-6-metoxy-1,4-benzoquinol methylase
MTFLHSLVERLRARARTGRAAVFRHEFSVGETTRVLDIGSEDGTAIARVLAGTGILPQNVYIADIDAARVEAGQRQFGFVPVVIPESGRLPFADGFFDIVYCSSVIEHVTVPKNEVWSARSGKVFSRRAEQSQAAFAQEIRRLGKRYFVQTPNKWFPIESHTWLPFIGFAPRSAQLATIAVSNRFWIKRTSPDWHLLTAREMSTLFPDAEIRREIFLGLTKSIMAIRR